MKHKSLVVLVNANENEVNSRRSFELTKLRNLLSPYTEENSLSAIKQEESY